MELIYRGRYHGDDGVVISESGQRCVRGETIEVDDDLGVRLCEQEENWTPAPRSVPFFVEFCQLVAAATAATPAPPLSSGGVEILPPAEIPNYGIEALGGAEIPVESFVPNITNTPSDEE